MFTGIIQELGAVARVERANGIMRLSLHAPQTVSRLRRLDSLAVNGVCLSVVRVRQGVIACEVISETQRLTTLGRLRAHDRVHLEPSLTLLDRLNGHFVFGHVDGMGTVVKRRQLSGELVLDIRAPEAIRHLIVPKGPITVDGVSLTVGRAVTRNTFTVHLIPETLRQTVLRLRAVGDRVNLEADYIAKLVCQFLRTR